MIILNQPTSQTITALSQDIINHLTKNIGVNLATNLFQEAYGLQ